MGYDFESLNRPAPRQRGGALDLAQHKARKPLRKAAQAAVTRPTHPTALPHAADLSPNGTIHRPRDAAQKTRYTPVPVLQRICPRIHRTALGRPDPNKNPAACDKLHHTPVARPGDLSVLLT